MCGVIGGFPMKKKKITNENKSSFDSEFNNVLYYDNKNIAKLLFKYVNDGSRSEIIIRNNIYDDGKIDAARTLIPEMCDFSNRACETCTSAGQRDRVMKAPAKRFSRLREMATLVMSGQKTKRERETSTAEGGLAVSVSGSKKKRVSRGSKSMSDADPEREVVLRDALVGKVEPENLNWLVRTADARKFLAPDQSPTVDLREHLSKTVNQLISHDKIASTRAADIKQEIKNRLIATERSKLDEKWVDYTADIIIPGGSVFGLGAQLAQMISPPGVLIKSFLPLPGGAIGPLQATQNAKVGDVIVSINRAKVDTTNMHTAMMTLNMIAQVAHISKQDQSLSLRISRFERASPSALANAIKRALEPTIVSKLENSPLIQAYAQATQPALGVELEYWLLNRSSVVSEIFAPYERTDELDELFRKHGYSVKGGEGLLHKELSCEKMYGLFDVASLLRKYIDDGEVGRGRNKTSLKTAKQVCTAVVSHLKKCLAS